MLGDDVLLYEQVVALCQVTRLDEVVVLSQIKVVVSQIEVVVLSQIEVVVSQIEVVVLSEMVLVLYHK